MRCIPFYNVVIKHKHERGVSAATAPQQQRIPPSASILKSILQRTTRSRDYMDHHERARAQQKLQDMDELDRKPAQPR